MKKVVLAVLFSILLVFNAEASLISFYVIETGVPENVGRIQHSLTWEDAFMEVFFESGYIVSNYPMMRLAQKPNGNILEISGFDIFEAKDAGIDYILISLIDYSSPYQLPDRVSIYIFTTKNHEVIYERHLAGRSYRNEREEFDGLKSVIRDLVRFVTNL
jgi:hypothetical protein